MIRLIVGCIPSGQVAFRLPYLVQIGLRVSGLELGNILIITKIS